MYGGWLGMEGKILVAEMHKKTRPLMFYGGHAKRPDGDSYSTTGFFVLPQLSKDRIVMGGVNIDPDYLKQTFFPAVLEELIERKVTEGSGKPLAMMVYPVDSEMHGTKMVAASSGWSEGKPEVSRKLDDVFDGLALGIKFQGTSVMAIGQRWIQQSFLILGGLSF